MNEDLSQLTMLELFRVEAEQQTGALTAGLLELERGAATAGQLEGLMRAAHSLKGAARIVNLPVAVRVAHAMEDSFVAAQQGRVTLSRPQIDILLRGVDWLLQISKCTEAGLAAWESEQAGGLEQFLSDAATILPGPAEMKNATFKMQNEETRPALAEMQNAKCKMANDSAFCISHSAFPPAPPSDVAGASAVATEKSSPPEIAPKVGPPERVVRLNADNLNRLLGLAGESLVESRWLRPFSDSMQRLQRLQSELEHALDGLRQSLDASLLSALAAAHLTELVQKAGDTRQFLTERLQEFDLYDRRSAHLSNRLYLEVLRTRMRPFADGVRRFPRMVRDLARSLGKQARLEIVGESTQVDRDILDRLEAPLTHLLRNAVDHGCETPAVRAAAGKPPEAIIQLEARHSAGLLLVTISDDGAGVDTKRLRKVVAAKKLTTALLAEKLSEAELLEFLFLPGFTMKDAVTDISGRGVGLDVVQNMVKSVRGTMRVATQAGRGTRFQLQLPLTLSVLRTLLVEVADEPYAIPLAQILHTLKLDRGQIETLEGRHHFAYGDQRLGLLTAHQVFDCGQPKPAEHGWPVVVLGDRNSRYGLVVDKFLGERELVVQPLDARLGKVKDISAAALMEDGSPVLIVDVDDLVRSIDKLVSSGSLTGVQRTGLETHAKKKKRILAVDDSLTVRELERKLLTSHGYLADVAVDGTDGWNAVRTGIYDLVITDLDMPLMDGIELATLIKKDAHLKSLPVMIVSYKDREEDRLRGLEAGADYYLTKGSFNDETLLQAVLDLIGEPEG
jgi:two-component system sensor histidine kinase and response regulator WspE